MILPRLTTNAWTTLVEMYRTAADAQKAKLSLGGLAAAPHDLSANKTTDPFETRDFIVTLLNESRVVTRIVTATSLDRAATVAINMLVRDGVAEEGEFDSMRISEVFLPEDA